MFSKDLKPRENINQRLSMRNIDKKISQVRNKNQDFSDKI